MPALSQQNREKFYRHLPLSSTVFWMLVADSGYKAACCWRLHTPLSGAFNATESKCAINEHLKSTFSRLFVDYRSIEPHLKDELPYYEWLCRFERYVIPFMVKHYR